MKRWQDLTWPEVSSVVSERPIALLPLGAIEEHGPHLPLGTDAFTAGSFASMICETADIIELPVMPYGQVWSLEHFEGSLSVSDETLISMIVELTQGLERAGIKGVVLMSTHLGNAAAIKKASRVLAEKGSISALALTYPGLATISARVREAEESHPEIMHADEIETSIMLSLHPSYVQMNLAVAEYPEYPTSFNAEAIRWNTLSDSGVFGDATAATEEKGEILVEHVLEAAVSLIEGWKKAIL